MGDPRPEAEIETIASGAVALSTAVAGRAAPLASADGPGEVSPEHYRVEGEFARGGMGRVLLARDRRLGRTVALKELHADARRRGRGPLRARGARRPRACSTRRSCPSTRPGAGRTGEPFYAMKLVEGRSLDAADRATPARSPSASRCSPT